MNMNFNQLPKQTAILGLVWLALAAVLSAQAQSTATWIGPSGDEWNTAADWDLGAPPTDVTTNAAIASGGIVNYNLPMASGSIGSVTVSTASTLNINQTGFVVGFAGNGAVTVTGSGSKLYVNSGGSLSLTNGGLTFATAGGGALYPGGRLTISGALNVGTTSTTGNTGFMTNNGGTLTAASTAINPNNNSSSSLMVINGGTNNLGNTTVLRSSAGSGGYTALGTEGLLISNGAVTMSSLSVGSAAANSFLTMLVAGGVVTNTGDFVVRQVTSARGSRFLQTGGLMVSTGTNPVQIGVTNAGQIVIFSVTGGTNLAPGFLLGNLTNVSGTVNFTNAGRIYVGSGGLVSNVVQNLNVALNNGGVFGATADWVGAVPMILTSGSFIFDAEDVGGNAHDILLNGRLSGGGGLTKAGAGTLTLNATNSFTGNVTVSQGTLALGATGSISNSSQISISGGAFFDVSAAPGFALLGSQKLAGTGTAKGAVTALSGAAIQPAGNGAGGTLSFGNGLAEAGGVINNFDLSDDPTGTSKVNDFVFVTGDLNLSGTNTIQINALSGPLPARVPYKLMQYSGNLVGDISNLALAGATGYLSNNVATKTIVMVVQSQVRASSSIVWVGNALNNNWDTVATTNWLNGTTLDYFVSGDAVRFDALGAAHAAINIAGSVNPSSMTVDAAAAYSFGGVGTIDGTGGLTKTNTGTLSILTANNNYPGSTIIGQGMLEVVKLANTGSPSSIGAASSDPANLVFFGTTLRYLGGSASTDRSATLNGTGATFEVATNGTSLTLNGSLAGPGGLVKTGPGALVLAGAGLYEGPTAVSGGTVQINSAVTSIGTNAINFSGGTLVMNVSGQPTYANALNVVADSSLTSAGGNNNVVTGPWSGGATLNLSIATNGTFTINHDMTTNFTGTIALANSAGTFRFNGGGSSSGAQQSVGSPAATFDLGTGYATLLNRNGGGALYGLYFLGGLAGGSNTTVRGSANAGSPNTYQVGDNNRNTTFAGTITNGGGGAGAVVTLLKAGTGTLTLSGSSTYTGPTIVSNGVLALRDFGTLASTPMIDLAAGAILDVAGRTDGLLNLTTGQSLTGDGTVNGAVLAETGAVISPGENPTALPPGAAVVGQLTITNVLILESGSTVQMDVDKASGTNDLITGLVVVNFGGTLDVSQIPNLFVVGDSFKLFSAKAYRGAFESINPPTPASGLFWDTSHLTVDGTLRVTVQRPVINGITLQGAELIISGTNGIPFGNYYLLTSTNIGLPLAQWTSIGTNTFQSDGSFSVTNAFTPVSPRQFFLLQVP
jgi:autotransporter-associated beta strand protein